MRHKKMRFILIGVALVALAILLTVASVPATPAAGLLKVGVANAAASDCVGCHDNKIADMAGGKHATLQCEACHGQAETDAHLADTSVPKDPYLYPRVPFNKEVCATCHSDQYNSFLIVAGGRTLYGGSDEHNPADPNDPPAPKGWSKTSDLPYWNVLIDGHPFALETYEDRPMAVNQIEHQETIRPGSESCMACHGTKLAYYMGIVYEDASGQIKTEQMVPNGSGYSPREVLVKGGTYLPPAPGDPNYSQYPQGGTWNNPPSALTGHLIYDGTSYKNPADGAWEEAVTVTFIPNGTKISTYIDAIDPVFPYQVKTLVTLPAPVTVIVPNTGNLGNPLGQITFDTISSYPESGADINGVTGCTVIDANCPNSQGVANVARNWAYAAMEAMAFDGLDYEFDPLVENPDTRDLLASGYYETHFTGSGTNWPSIQSGQLCNQCHDPMSAKPRVIKKSLIEAIAVRGINPYSPTGSQVRTFEQASRQDQIIAQCAQCHSEYVGGYSANTSRDGDYFPWAKPADLENLYRTLFNYLQDWSHGAPIAPWQSTDANARGFTPYGQRYVIGAPLVKVQHPEAEEFLNSPMYNAGATCTDCHSSRVTRPDGTRYTSHWFTSPLKIMQGYSGTTFKGENIAGDPITMAPQNPCAKCHTTDTSAQSQARIKSQQDTFYFLQERTQVALVNALKYIREQQLAGVDQSANITTYQRAAMRWEYYTQAENSMSFHNNPEAVTEVSNARIWVDGFIPWPLTPVKVRITATGLDTLTLTFYDQANNESGFIVERAPALEGPYTQVASLSTPNGANIGDVSWTDTVLASGTKYFYRVAAHNAAGASVYSVWATATTLGTAIAAPTDLLATAVSGSQIDLTWTDNSLDETGFRVERAKDAAFTVGLTTFSTAADAIAFSDTGLTPETTYYYRVFAVGVSAVSAPSATASATTLAATPITPPSGLAVTAVSSSQINLTWADNSADETGFRVERAKDATFIVGFAAFEVAAGAIAFSDTGLTPETTYYYRVFALRLNETSAASNTASATTLPVPPAAPTNLIVKSVGQTTITISWKDNSTNETGFYVWRKNGAGVWTRLPTLFTTTTYTDTGLKRRTSYSYRVQAYNAAGGSAYSNVVTAKTK